MKEIDRRTFIAGLGAAVAISPGVTLRAAVASAGLNASLTRINRDYLVTAEQVHAWHVVKDSKGGPTLAGSPSWKNYLQLLERELRAASVVDIFRNPFTYKRWYTTEWPDDSNWSLHVDGRPIKIASYGCNSGSTPAEGVTGGLVVFKPDMPAASLRGKIAVIVKPLPTTPMTGDYEYLASAESFQNPATPSVQEPPVSPFRMMGLGDTTQALIAAGAIGAVIVMPLSHDAVAGIYTFGVPALHDMPTLYADKGVGAQLVELASAGKNATLKLIAQTEQAETYQLFGYLPGRDYGTPADKHVLIVTHTDGPSISQENGALGILAMVKYFSRIPKSVRPRTLMVFFDCRHYMPGAERAFASQDYAASHPDIYKNVIAAMGIEHLGQLQVAEGPSQPYHMTPLAELSSVWVSPNQHLVDVAVKAVKDNSLSRVQVQAPGRPGSHGGDQAPWYGLGGIARRLGVPGAATMGLLSGYWTTRARIGYLDAKHFVKQAATMSQICGELMVAEVDAIKIV